MAMFDGVRSRFWGYVGDQLQTFGAMKLDEWRRGPAARERDDWYLYAQRWAYYENRRLYDVLKRAGVRDVAMPTEWNPVPATAAFYMANTLGRGLDIAADEASATNAELVRAIKRIWDWSNFDVLAGEMVETAAVLGRVFVKVAERQEDGGEGDSAGRTTSVYLQNLPPESVRRWEADERGFLTSIRIDTPRLRSIFSGEERRHTLVEVWRKEWPAGPLAGQGGVAFYEVMSGRAADDTLGEPVRAQTFDDLGYDFIPVVWADVPTYWWQMIDQVDRYNQMAMKIDRLNRPLGVVLGRHMDRDGRPMPAPRVATEDVETTYQEAADGAVAWLLVPGNSEFDWAEAPIDMATARAQMLGVREGVEAALPEYRVATLDATQIAAETLQLLLSQAGQRVLEQRKILERALVRAQMMAVSIGQAAMLPGFDAADVGSWEEGTIEHTFVERDVFEIPTAMKATILKELVAAGVPVKLAMKRAGFSPAEIAEYDAAAAEESLRRQTTLAAQLSRQAALFDSGAADNGLTRP